MSNILNIKNLDGDWDSIVAIRGKQGEPGADGTKFTVQREYIEGEGTVKIATFHTDNNGVTEDVEIFAPTSGGGGGSDVSFVEGTQFENSTTVGTLKIAGKGDFPINVPSKVSDFTNDAGYITEDDIPPIPEVPTKVSELENDEGFVKAEDIPAFPTKVSDLENDAEYVNSDALSTLATNVYGRDEWYNEEYTYQIGELCSYNGRLWECIAECTGIVPGSETSLIKHWQNVSLSSVAEAMREKLHLIWENDSPTSSFAAQTFTPFALNAKAYSFFIVIAAVGTTTNTSKYFLPAAIVPNINNRSARLQLVTNKNYYRTITFKDGSITFTDCNVVDSYGASSSATANAYVIPRYIYGF